MAELTDVSLPLRTFLRAYPWRRIDPIPWAPTKKPLSQSRLALISSAGFVLPDQPPFDDSIRGGDVSFRQIPRDTPVSALIDTHRSDSFDHTGLSRDPNLAFPLDRVRELLAAGRIGSLSRAHLSCMGSITAPKRLIRTTAPEMAATLVDDSVDIALLVPV